MKTRKLTDKEIKINNKSIERLTQDIEDNKFKVEGKKFTLSRLNTDIDIQKRKLKKNLDRDISDLENDIRYKENTIRTLKYHIKNGVEVKEEPKEE